MVIFLSYVSLPEGTKHLEQWHDQTPHISPPRHGSFQHGIYTFPRKNFWHLLATLTRVPSLFQPVWTTSPEKQYVATSKSMIPYISIHHMNHIIIYLHMLPVTIFTPYLFGGKYTTPSVGARLKGPRNLRSKWGREIWGRAGLESDSRRFHWYSSHIDISFQS
jgi:hypothetical protein